MNLREVIDGFYLTEEEQEFFQSIKEALDPKKLIYRVPVVLTVLFIYCQVINAVDYIIHLQG